MLDKTYIETIYAVDISKKKKRERIKTERGERQMKSV